MNMTEKELGEILTDEQLGDVEKFLKKDDMKGLRQYLMDIGDQLRDKGVLPTYIYYWFEFKKNKIKEII